MSNNIITVETKLKRIGYWNNKMNAFPQYPNPADLVDPVYYLKANRIYIRQYLDGGIACNHYRGFSACRICGEMLSTFERHDNMYIWPDGLSHYIGHDVRLPDEFIAHMMKYVIVNDVDESDWIVKEKDT